MIHLDRTIRVHWGHCDPARIVFHPNFMVWIDEGIADLFRHAGVDFDAVLADDPAFVGTPIVQSQSRYRSPARYGDDLRHRTEVTALGRRSITFANRFHIGDRTVVEEEQVRIWGRAAPTDDGSETLEAAQIPAAVVACLRG